MRFVTVFLMISFWILTIFARDVSPKIDKNKVFKTNVAKAKVEFKLPGKTESPIIPLSESPVLPLKKTADLYDQIFTDHSFVIKIDSSRNGFGWFNARIRSIDHFMGIDASGLDADFVIAGYRQYNVSIAATGIIGATSINVANGLENGVFYRYAELNQDLGPFPPNDPYNTIGGRYPGAVALDRPFIHFNQYMSGNPSAEPPTPPVSHPYLITDYLSYGDMGGTWTPSIRMDVGYQHYNFDENRLWNGPVEIVKDQNGTYHYLGAYSNWVIEGESQPYDYVLLNAQADDPTAEWDIDTNPSVIDNTTNLFWAPSLSMNSSGFGACVGIGHEGPHPGETVLYVDLRLMLMVTHDYGKTWTTVREIDWPELGIKDQITQEDSIFVPVGEDSIGLFEGEAWFALYNNFGVDVLVSESNDIYIAYNMLGGPKVIEKDSTGAILDTIYYLDPHYSALRLAYSNDGGNQFKDAIIAYNNGFFVGDSNIAGANNIYNDFEADLALDEEGNLYAVWLDRPHKDVEMAEKNRYGFTIEEGLLKADVFVARSLDGGKTWTEPINVTQTMHIDEYELRGVRHASSKNNGTLHFAYCEVDPSTPVDLTKGEEDNYTYRVNRIWIGEARDFTENNVGIDPKPNLIVHDHTLLQNYPNPFNPKTRIAFRSPKAGKAILNVYDVNGRLVQKLFNQRIKSNQLYQVDFDGTNLSSGIYFYRLNVNGHFTTGKMVLMR